MLVVLKLQWEIDTYKRRNQRSVLPLLGSRLAAVREGFCRRFMEIFWGGRKRMRTFFRRFAERAKGERGFF